jgi:hypothetical protein
MLRLHHKAFRDQAESLPGFETPTTSTGSARFALLMCFNNKAKRFKG